MVVTRSRSSVRSGPPEELMQFMTNYDPDHRNSQIIQDARFKLVKDKLSLREVIEIFKTCIASNMPAYMRNQNDLSLGTCAELTEFSNLPSMRTSPHGHWSWNGCYIVFDTHKNKNYIRGTNNDWMIEMAGECYKCKHACKMRERCGLFEGIEE